MLGETKLWCGSEGGHLHQKSKFIGSIFNVEILMSWANIIYQGRWRLGLRGLIRCKNISKSFGRLQTELKFENEMVFPILLLLCLLLIWLDYIRIQVTFHWDLRHSMAAFGFIKGQSLGHMPAGKDFTKQTETER